METGNSNGEIEISTAKTESMNDENLQYEQPKLDRRQVTSWNDHNVKPLTYLFCFLGGDIEEEAVGRRHLWRHWEGTPEERHLIRNHCGKTWDNLGPHWVTSDNLGSSGIIYLRSSRIIWELGSSRIIWAYFIAYQLNVSIFCTCTLVDVTVCHILTIHNRTEAR